MSERASYPIASPTKPARTGLAGIWSRAREPSLVRRLVSAQMAMLLLLWTVVLAAVVWTARNGDGLVDSEPAFDAVVVVAESLKDRPEQQQQSLRALDRVLHSFGSGADSTRLVPTLLVWQDDHLLYRSAGSLSAVRVEASSSVKHVLVDGHRWLARSRRTGDGQLLVTLLIPDTYELIVKLSSRGFYLLPLLVSLPFLIFPALISVRVALRPWRRLSADVASRHPGDLSPLSPLPQQRELRPLATELNRLFLQIAGSSLRERNLIADAAHQLRTPLAALSIGVEALARHRVPRELMDQLQRTSTRATRLVDQLLRLMRSDSVDAESPIVVTDIDLDTLLHERLALFDAIAHAKRVELEYDGDPAAALRGDREGLEALIDNIVENGIKYAPPHSVVNVVLTAMPLFVRLEVLDRGPGIEPQWRERVFDRFFRAPDQAQSGSGLGLAIVRSVVDHHAGEITLSNRGGGGLCVRIDLPRRHSPKVAPAG